MLLNNGESVSLEGDLELVGDYVVLTNGHATYRFHWLNVLYYRSRVKR